MEEPEPARRLETVDFAPVRIDGPGRRLPSTLFVGLSLAVLGSVVALATLGRSGSDATAPGPVSAAGRATPAPLTAGPSVALDPRLPGPLRADDPEALAISVKSTAGGVSVHGTVLLRSVSSLAIRIVDGEGGEIAARSLSLQNPDAGAIRPGIAPAFAVLIGLSDAALRDARFVEVDAYDGLGATLGSVLHWLGPPHAICRSGPDCPSS